MKSTTIMFTIVKTMLLFPILLVSSKDFDQEACPNNCSYHSHQVTTISCQGQQDTWIVPDGSTHLILEGCGDLSKLNIQPLGHIVSTTIKDSTIDQNPVDLFHNLSHIKCLRFEAVRFDGNSSLTDYFRPLVNLEFIEFNFTLLSYTEMQDLLRGFTRKHKLNSLILTQGGLGGKDLHLGYILKALNETKLTCLTVQHEMGRQLTLSKFKDSAPYLKILNFLKCRRIEGKEALGFQSIIQQKHLKVIRITYYDNALIWPDTYGHHRSKRSLIYIDEYMKRNTEKYITENNIPYIDRCIGDKLLLSGDLLPPIEKILLEHSDLRIINSHSLTCFFAYKFQVEMINFSYSLVLKDLFGLNFIFFGFDNLRYFNAEGNSISKIPDIFFYFLPNLETLLLGKNNLRNTISSDKNGTLFSKLSSLKYLDLSENNIQSIPNKTFSGLNQLRTLNLSGNILMTVEIDFTRLKSLEMLDLCLNIISTLSSVTTYSVDKIMGINTDLKINITKNQLRCSCGNLKFIEWFQEKGHSIIFDYSYLNCSNTYGKMESLALVNLQTLGTFCDPLKAWEIAVIVVILIFVAFIAALVYVIYRKRHQWRYWVFRMYYYRNKREEESESYLYDAYVCYSSDDSEFVHNILRPTLEDTYNFRLCIDKRDFEVGNFITNNILESIEQSRKTLLVLSPSFLESDWCKYEMHMAYSKLLHYGVDIIVPLLYKSFDLKNTDSTLRSLMIKKTYIEWNDGRGRFWDHLCLILNNGESLNTAL